MQFGNHRRGGEAEHARVPQEVAALQIMRGGLQVGFFHEALHFGRAFGVQWRTGFDVAEAGLRGCRDHAEGHQITVFRQIDRVLDRTFQRALIDDQVVGRHHHHDRVIAMQGLQRQRRCGDGRCGVTPGRLQQEVPAMARQVGGAVVILALEVVLAVGHRDNVAPTVEQRCRTLVRLAQ